MLREVVTVAVSACNACGSCLTTCPHEALEVVDGHARLVKELLCSGCGACLESCGGALHLEVRDVAPHDVAATRQRLEQRARLRALAED